MDPLRLKLKGKPSLSKVFGLAGYDDSKVQWLRIQPDLRISVLVRLCRVLKIRPGRALDMIVAESVTDSHGRIHF